MASMNRRQLRTRIHQRIRRKLSGTADRPRLSVYFTNQNIYAQLIDDGSGTTLVSASTKEKGEKGSSNCASAAEVGKRLAERAAAKGYGAVVFDRGGFLYHGKVKALADAAREAGLQF